MLVMLICKISSICAHILDSIDDILQYKKVGGNGHNCSIHGFHMINTIWAIQCVNIWFCNSLLCLRILLNSCLLAVTKNVAYGLL